MPPIIRKPLTDRVAIPPVVIEAVEERNKYRSRATINDKLFVLNVVQRRTANIGAS